MEYPVLVSVISSFLGGSFFSGFVIYCLNSRRAEREVLRGKLECIYKDFMLLGRKNSLRMVQLEAYVFERQANINVDYPDGNFEKVDFELIESRIEIYFPGVSNCYRGYNEAVELVFSKALDVYVNRDEELVGRDFYMEMNDLVNNGEKYKSVVFKALLEEARKINRFFISARFG